MKKIILFLLCLCLLGASFLVACGAEELPPQMQEPDFGGGDDSTLPEVVPPPVVPPVVPTPPEVVPPVVPTPPEVVPPVVPPVVPTPPPVVPPTPQKQYDRLIKSTTSGLNIRSGAGTSYSSLGKMDKGDALPYLGSSGSWYKTTYKGKTAYVSTPNSSIFSIEKAAAKREQIIEFGKTLMGYPYVYGAERVHHGNGVYNLKFKATVFDCSSFTQYIYYKAVGINLYTTTRSQVSQGKYTATVQRGDLMFFTNESRVHLSGNERIGHVGIYLGDNYILHTSSDYSVIEPISSTRWSYFIAARTFV